MLPAKALLLKCIIYFFLLATVRPLRPVVRGVLTTGTEVPVVTQATVGTNLLQTLKVITELGLDVVRQDLRVLTSREVLLSVKEPRRDLELLR